MAGHKGDCLVTSEILGELFDLGGIMFSRLLRTLVVVFEGSLIRSRVVSECEMCGFQA